MRDPYKVMDGAVQAALRRGAGLVSFDANVPTGSQPGSDEGPEHDPKNGQFIAGPGATATNHAQHTAQASYHKEKAAAHRGSNEHKAAERHDIAATHHEDAAAAHGAFHKSRHMRSSIANESSKEAERHTTNIAAKKAAE